eukprot:scaffold13930_cov131-Isochrysis_galbana.AAC.4
MMRHLQPCRATPSRIRASSRSVHIDRPGELRVGFLGDGRGAAGEQRVGGGLDLLGGVRRAGLLDPVPPIPHGVRRPVGKLGGDLDPLRAKLAHRRQDGQVLFLRPLHLPPALGAAQHRLDRAGTRRWPELHQHLWAGWRLHRPTRRCGLSSRQVALAGRPRRGRVEVHLVLWVACVGAGVDPK